jgi:hypothetical protein
MADKSSIKDAIMALAKEIDAVFKKYSRQARSKAWERMTSKDGEREVKKIMDNPGRSLAPFAKLANQRESADNPVRVWLDDLRPMPIGFDLHARTAEEAIEIIESGRVSEISLDHDLGSEENGTGYEVAKFIEEGAYHGYVAFMEVKVHSANPVGAKNIQACIDNANHFWGAS